MTTVDRIDLTLPAGFRSRLRHVASRLQDSDLGRAARRTRPDGTQIDSTPRWALYHMLEHEAQHIGQIQLLEHQRRVAAGVR